MRNEWPDEQNKMRERKAGWDQKRVDVREIWDIKQRNGKKIKGGRNFTSVVLLPSFWFYTHTNMWSREFAAGPAPCLNLHAWLRPIYWLAGVPDLTDSPPRPTLPHVHMHRTLNAHTLPLSLPPSALPELLTRRSGSWPERRRQADGNVESITRASKSRTRVIGSHTFEKAWSKIFYLASYWWQLFSSWYCILYFLFPQFSSWKITNSLQIPPSHA